jgi:hypothetical protein
MGAIKALFTQNYLTTFFGILAGLPILVANSGLALSPKMGHYLTVAAALGVIGLGVVSKAFNTHSTTAQVQMSSLQNPQIQAEAVVEAKKEAIAVPSGVPIVQPVPIVVPKAPEVKPPQEAPK